MTLYRATAASSPEHLSVRRRLQEWQLQAGRAAHNIKEFLVNSHLFKYINLKKDPVQQSNNSVFFRKIAGSLACHFRNILQQRNMCKRKSPLPWTAASPSGLPNGGGRRGDGRLDGQSAPGRWGQVAGCFPACRRSRGWEGAPVAFDRGRGARGAGGRDGGGVGWGRGGRRH
ncbi:hypothetical protein BRADI_2g05595v3 [Brachypodium distachyon]|uniref:Uncharacterized protein n=1 Tax=Brachypodium distachyon TaxID=15368 RepID=A0A0Q3IB68_BRADI|nr:hypothetical protein BRADI_2g05595v3 [Brachypodium distachyon]